ncbi:MAG: DNA polymerase I, partial [Clostridiales bacterium]|nr:DNA polymerase I [Clostridiales bacterium]
MRETCLIVDGHSLMHRAYFALPPMDHDGVPTNAVHGFLAMLLKAFDDYHPQYCVVAFDEHGPTFRHEQYAAYKEGRAPMADDLRPQFPVLMEILSSMGVGVLSKPGYEADDLLGTISRRASENGIDSLLLTGDRDALQLVGDDVSLLFTRKGISDIVRFTPEQVKENYGITPEQVPDWKGLMGDASDNIPGVPGVGDKTAVKLLNEYGTLESVLDNADHIKGKLGERLRDNKEQAVHSRALAVIDQNVPVDFSLADWRLTQLTDGLPTLKKYGLNTASERVRHIARAHGPVETQEQPAQEIWQAWETPENAQDVTEFAQGAVDLAIHVSGADLSLARDDGRRMQITTTPQQLDMLSTAGPLTMEEVLHAAAKASDQKGIAAHDAKALFHRMRNAGAPIPPLAWDTLIAAYLHNPQEKSFALQQFAAPDACGVSDLRRAQTQQLQDEGMTDLYNDIELPLVNVLYDMEVVGFPVDKQVLVELGQVFSEQTAQLQDSIYRESGVGDFNVNSPQQLGKVLFEDLGLPFRRKTKSGYSTDADTLE